MYCLFCFSVHTNGFVCEQSQKAAILGALGPAHRCDFCEKPSVTTGWSFHVCKDHEQLKDGGQIAEAR